jgi:hypothetical protein
VIGVVVFLCYAAAAFFLGCLVFDATLGDTDRLAAGLFCIALGLMLGTLSPAFTYVEARGRPRG